MCKGCVKTSGPTVKEHASLSTQSTESCISSVTTQALIPIREQLISTCLHSDFYVFTDKGGRLSTLSTGPITTTTLI